MPRHGESFDSAWRERTVVAPTSLTVAMPFIMRHYLKKRPGVVTLCMGVFIDGWARGVVVFSMPPSETMVRYGGVTWELARLFLDDELPRNAETFVIGASIRYIQRSIPSVAFLVSYADPSHGHTGAIYRASNWISDGRTDEGRKTARVDYRVGDKSYGRRKHIPNGVEFCRVPRVSKFRFVYPMKSRQRGGLRTFSTRTNTAPVVQPQQSQQGRQLSQSLARPAHSETTLQRDVVMSSWVTSLTAYEVA